MLKLVVAIVAMLMIGACAPVDAFKEPSDNDRHALLFCQDSSSVISGSQAVFPLEINGKSVYGASKWSFKQFNLVPGNTTILAKVPVSATVMASGIVKFDAAEGQRYYLKVNNQIEDVMILVENQDGDTVASVLANKTAQLEGGHMIPIMIPTK